MAKYNLTGPVDAVQYIEGTTSHPSVSVMKGEYDMTFPVLYESGSSGDYDVLVDGDWIVTGADGRNFAVDEFCSRVFLKR